MVKSLATQANKADLAELRRSTGTQGALYRASLKNLEYRSQDVGALMCGRLVTIDDPTAMPNMIAGVGWEIWEDQPRLDLRVLAANGLLGDNQLTYITLPWRMNKEVHDCHVCINTVFRADPTVELIFGTPDRAVCQVLHLTPRPAKGPHRYRFSIPGFGAADVVGYRLFRFAPRQLQKLVHRSQRKARLTPAAKVQQQLLSTMARKRERSQG